MDTDVDLLPPNNDYVFAQLFGARSHKRVLVCLLNSILNGKPHIKSITLDPTEYKKKTADGKSMRLDIAATTDDGTRINVEIQCYEVDNVEDRAAFYRYQLQERELHAGDDYSSVPNIISIWILTENATRRKYCCNEIVMMYKANEMDPVEIASEKMRNFIIELAKLEATPKSFLNDMFTVWMRFIKDPLSIPPEFLDIPEVKEAMDELTVMSMDQKMRDEYYARLKQLNDYQALRTAVAKATKAAKAAKKKAKDAEAKAKDAEKKLAQEQEKTKKEKIEMAKKFLAMGLSVEQIAQGTGLSTEELEKLR